MTGLRLVIFDVDGTLVDSQTDILAAMTHAFESQAMAVPSPAQVLSIVGLSLDVAIARLVPTVAPANLSRLVAAYKDAYMDMRIRVGAAEGSPLYPGARAVLDRLAGEPHTLLAVATGKSKRGLDKLIEAHDLKGMFVSLQVADFHPSKPHPAMVLAALAETGVAASRAVMVGDTTFDMEMGRAAGVGTIGVAWGYHPAADLNADVLVDSYAALPGAIDRLLEPVA
jgi:phosphoglycolate phosphatase